SVSGTSRPSVLAVLRFTGEKNRLRCLSLPEASLINCSRLLVADVVDAGDVSRAVPNRLIARDVRRAQNGNLSIEGLTLPDGGDGLAGGVQNGPDRPTAAVRLRHVRRNADRGVARFHEQPGPSPSPCHRLLEH